VGLTRAKKSLTLIYGTYWETDWGKKNDYGVSRFVKDVLAYLDSK
jgi:superfamily I DNA/RNA helicase